MTPKHIQLFRNTEERVSLAAGGDVDVWELTILPDNKIMGN